MTTQTCAKRKPPFGRLPFRFGAELTNMILVIVRILIAQRTPQCPPYRRLGAIGADPAFVSPSGN